MNPQGITQLRYPCTDPQRSVFAALLPASRGTRLSNRRDDLAYVEVPLRAAALRGKLPHRDIPWGTDTSRLPSPAW